jgi:hypothetical protein
MPVSFINSGDLDLNALATMGVNVKQTETAFGHFGTGLKYAIATLLRTGHKIELYTNGAWHHIGTSLTYIRDKPFQLITLDSRPLGFTTELGKNWKVWQAYRELRCNAQDEPDARIYASAYQPTPGETTFIVRGSEIETIHENAADFFLNSVPLASTNFAEIHSNRNSRLFYQGVCVYMLEEKPSLFTYNLTKKQILTEDRTLASTWNLPHELGSAVNALTDKKLVTEILLAGEKFYESDFRFYALSPMLLEIVAENKDNPRLNYTAREAWISTVDAAMVYTTAKLSSYEEKLVAEACDICRIIAPTFTEDFLIVETLGPDCLGQYRPNEKQIVISREAITQGVTILAGTLYEEWAHKYLEFEDMSRPFQNHLINRLVSFAQRCAS